MAQRSKLRVFRSALIIRALNLLAAIGRRIPLRLGRAFGVALGALAYRVVRRERAKAMRNLAIAFPEKTTIEHDAIVRGMFRHLGMSLFEIFWLPNLTKEKVNQWTVYEGFEHVNEFLEAGKGGVLFTGHCGNWEWLSTSVSTLGYDVNVIAREIYESRLNDFIVGIRATRGVKTIARGSASAAKELLRALRSRGLLGVLIDQRIKAENVEVPFFGVPATTPVGPAKLAIRAGAVAMAVFIERRPDGRQHVRFEPPVYTTRDTDATELTALMTKAIEEQIRRVPEQWVWMHERWKK
jgi:KDO2-lipid IV(A) lauroyltransferase